MFFAMGEKTDKSEDKYGMDNPLFPPGKTPKMIKLHFSGIKMGDFFDSSINPLPPNYIFHCFQDGTSSWTGTRPAHSSIDGHTMGIWFANVCEPSEAGYICSVIFDATFAFWDTRWPNPTRWNYIARQDDQYNDYYGGTARAFWITDTDNTQSVANIMSKFGISRGEKVFFEPLTNDLGQHIHRIADRKDGTCIHITTTNS